MKSILIISVLFYLSCPFLMANNLLKQDSLINKLSTLASDTNKVIAYYNIADVMYGKQPDKALKYADSSLSLSKELKYINGSLLAYNMIGKIYYTKSEFVKSQTYFNKAIKENENNANKTQLLSSLNNLGGVAIKMGNYPKAIEYFQKVLAISVKENKSILSAHSYCNIGVVNYYLKKYDLAISNFEQAIIYAETEPNFGIISLCQSNIGLCQIELNNINLGREFIRKSIVLKETLNDEFGLASEYGNLAQSFVNELNPDSAIYFLTLSNNYALPINAKSQIGLNALNMGKMLKYKNEYNSALSNTQKALSLFTETNELIEMNKAVDLLAQLYYNIKNYELAYKYKNLHKQYSDSLLNESNIEKITKTEMQHEFDKQQQQLTYENEKKQYILNIYILVLVITLLVILFLAFLYRQKQSKKQRKLQDSLFESRQQVLTQQMNPHFIFNTLNSIQNYIAQHKVESSIQYLSKFASLMRVMLVNSQHYTITLKDELEGIKVYAELEALRFKEPFTFHISVDDNINTELLKIPTYLIQPLIENSIKHGMQSIDTKGEINLTINNDADGIICIIEDNGTGLNSFEKSANKHKSLGTKLINKRLNLLSLYYDKDFALKVSNRTGASGTRAELRIPILNIH